MGLSKLAEKCRVCPFVDKCYKKCMEAHGYLEMPDLATPYAESISASMAKPILRETMTIMVNGKPTEVYKDEIEKQLYESLFLKLGLRCGG